MLEEEDVSRIVQIELGQRMTGMVLMEMWRQTDLSQRGRSLSRFRFVDLFPVTLLSFSGMTFFSLLLLWLFPLNFLFKMYFLTNSYTSCFPPE